MAAKRAASRGKRSRSTSKRRAKASRVRVTRSARRKGKPIGPDPLDQLIDAAAHVLTLPIDPAWKSAVKANLQVTLRLAASFADFPLPDDTEPAPVFVA
jgi:hypothetical protein